MSQLPKVIPQESPTDNPTMSILNTVHDGTLPVVTIIPTDQHVPSVDKNISPSNDGGANNTHKVLSRQPSHKRKENISLNNNSKRVKKNNTKTRLEIYLNEWETRRPRNDAENRCGSEGSGLRPSTVAAKFETKTYVF